MLTDDNITCIDSGIFSDCSAATEIGLVGMVRAQCSGGTGFGSDSRRNDFVLILNYFPCVFTILHLAENNPIKAGIAHGI